MSSGETFRIQWVQLPDEGLTPWLSRTGYYCRPLQDGWHTRTRHQARSDECIRAEIMARIKKEAGGCWIWTGRRRRDGEPLHYNGHHDLLIRRWIWEHYRGALRLQDIVRRTCHNRRCVSPHDGHARLTLNNSRQRGKQRESERQNLAV